MSELNRSAHAGFDGKAANVIIDPEVQIDIYNLFHSGPLMGKCLEYRSTVVFKGDMLLAWGDDESTGKPIQHDAAIALSTFLTRAMEYKEMYGMAPVRVSKAKRPGVRGLDGRKFPAVIPPISTGHFVIDLDPKKLTTRVVFELSSSSRSQGQRKVTLPVFVWPGHEPVHHLRQFTSTGVRIMDAHFRVEAMRRNADDADFRAAHPVLMTQTHPTAHKATALTEEEVYGSLDDPDVVPEQDQRSYRRNLQRTIQLELTARAMNDAAKGVTLATDAQKHFNAQTAQIESVSRTRGWDGATHQIPDGEVMASPIIPLIRRDLAEQEESYKDFICLMLGVPRNYIEAGTTGRFKADSEREREILRVTIDRDRKAAAEFFGWVYEIINRDADNETLVRALLLLDALKSVAPTPKHATVAKGLRRRVKRVARMPARARLSFGEDPLPHLVPRDLLLTAIARGAVTRHEEVNLLRSQLDLPFVEETDKLVKKPAPVPVGIPGVGQSLGGGGRAGAGAGAGAGAASQGQQAQQQQKPKEKKELKRKSGEGESGAKRGEEEKRKEKKSKT